ncbi:unknown [Prevotella sp. CAG:1092]|nr:unknown [Prevotella sp. CAG:1092]
MTLSNLLNLVDRHLSAISNTLAEQMISTGDSSLKECNLLFVHHSSLRTKEGIAVGLHLVKLQSELVCCKVAEVRYHTKDTDATSESCWFCKDVVGITAHIVATRSSHTTHRNYHRFLFLKQIYLVPHLFRSISRATTRVDSDNNSLYVVIVGKLFEVFANIIAHDSMRIREKASCSRSIHDVAISIVYSYLVVAISVFFLNSCHVGNRKLADFLVSIKLQ